MTQVSHLSYFGLLLAVFARQLCLPVPALLFLIVAGTMAANGQLHLGLVLGSGVLGCLGGDFIWFRIGRHWGGRVLRIVCSFSSNPRRSSQRAHNVFARWGLWVLLVAKFIPGLDGVTPPLAGAEGTSAAAFLLFDAFGAFFWSAAYTALGFVFADRLSLAIMWAKRFGTVLAIVVVLPCAIYVLWRGYLLLRMVGKLRLRRMSSALLASKLRGGDRVAVIDLASFEGQESESEGIPGAVRADPVRLSSYAKFTVPEDVAVVLYCSSRNALTSARVALALRRKGVTNVWVLDGGLASWKALGYEVTPDLSTPEELFSRLGIQLPHRNLP
jgi:membrane protein DedA with SNARE-associated domain/rhodanese-related sulfurtransferase